MIKAIAIDDEPPALNIIEDFCTQVDSVMLLRTFSKPSEALKYLRKFPVDLLFLDIQMSSLTGIEFYKKVEQDTMVIFTTAYSEYAVEGFNLSAVDYLLKPYTLERFKLAVNRANEYYNYLNKSEKVQQQYLFIRADYALTKISFSDILYIEGLDDYLKIYLINQKPVVARMTMKALQEKLPAKDFVRVHRSFIVPFARIETVRNKTILVTDTEIPIGSSYEDNFFQLFKTE